MNPEIAIIDAVTHTAFETRVIKASANCLILVNKLKNNFQNETYKVK